MNPLSLHIIAIYVITGLISSFLSGMLGIGGGLIIVPALLFIFSHFQIIPDSLLMHVTIGTSLASTVINLISSVIAHQRRNNIEWSVFRSMSPGIIVGALLFAPPIMAILSGNLLQVIFGVSCILISLNLFRPQAIINEIETLPKHKIMVALGVFSGTISVILGMAGGVIVGAILNYYHMNMRKVIGTTSSLAMILALSGSIGLMIVGIDEKNALPAWTTGFIYWPALLCLSLPSPLITPLGAKLALNLPIPILKRSFGAVVLIVGLKMFL